MLIFTTFRPATSMGTPRPGTAVLSFSRISVKGWFDRAEDLLNGICCALYKCNSHSAYPIQPPAEANLGRNTSSQDHSAEINCKDGCLVECHDFAPLFYRRWYSPDPRVSCAHYRGQFGLVAGAIVRREKSSSYRLLDMSSGQLTRAV